MRRILLGVIIVLGILFRLWASQPTWIHFDENYYFNIYQNFLDRGELTPYMWRLEGETNIIAGGGTGYGILVMIGWMFMFGDTLFSIRILMILVGIITAGIYFLIAEKWWDSKEAGITAMLFGIAGTSSFYSFVGRMDALGVLADSLILLLHITAVRQEKPRMHFWVGAGAILTVEFHVLGLLYVGALAFYYGVSYIQTFKNDKRLVLDNSSLNYFLGTGLFGLIYIIVHILPDPEAYFIIPSTCDICMKNIFVSSILICSRLIYQRPFEFILLVVVLYTEFRNKRYNQHFLILFVGYLISYLVIKPPPWIQYYFPMIPLLAIGLGGFTKKLLENSDSTRQIYLKNVFLLISILLLGINLFYFLSGRFPYINAYQIPDTPEITYIEENIPKEVVIMSSVENFYPLKEYRNFLDARDQLRYGLELRGEGFYEFLERIDPQVIYLEPELFSKHTTLQQYIKDQNIVQVAPRLWVASDLLNIDN